MLASMFVITTETLAAMAAAYRAEGGSLAAAAAVLQAEFRALSEAQAQTITARLLGLEVSAPAAPSE
jgi:hypothetical protein